MKRSTVLAVAALAAAPLSAQQNPFKLPHNSVAAVQVDYAFAGDLKGTGQRAASRDRVMARQTTTGKFFGKTATLDSWTLMTPDSTYSADLTKKTGVRGPNMMPLMAKAYDDLDGSGKRRLRQNMQDMVQLISRAFGTSAMVSDQKGVVRTFAGEKCEERAFGSFTICNMQGAAGVPLHVTGSLLCVDYEQTATAVHRGEPPASVFDPPAGIAFRDNLMDNLDSLARGYVGYLASQALTDSLAKAREQLAAGSSAGSAPGATAATREPTADERAQQRRACEALKNFDLGKEMHDAGKRVVGDALREAAKEKQNEVEQGAKNKIKGLIRRPHF